MRHASVSVRLASVSPAARKCFACVSRASGLCVANVSTASPRACVSRASCLRLAVGSLALRQRLACAVRKFEP